MITFEQKLSREVALEMYPAVLEGNADRFIDIAAALVHQLGKVLATLSANQSDEHMTKTLDIVMERLNFEARSSLDMIRNAKDSLENKVHSSETGVEMLNKLIQKGKEGKGE